LTEKVKKNSDVIWSKEHLYEQETELWDISNSIYSKKDARQRALERLKECLGGLLYIKLKLPIKSPK
jgi:hypothetical protein